MKRVGLIAALCASLALYTMPASAGVTGGGQRGSQAVAITASGSVTVPSWAKGAYVTLVGGGGGGASGLSAQGGGGGGGAGQTVYRVFTPVTPGSTLTATIGAAGAAGTAPNSGAKATPGGNTSLTGAVMVLPIAFGGGPACFGSGTCDTGSSDSAANYFGGGGGNPVYGTGNFVSWTFSASNGNENTLPTSTNDFTGLFNPGTPGSVASKATSCFTATPEIAISTNALSGGNGGCSMFGVGGLGGNNTGITAGNAGTGYGAGGGGGATDGTSTNAVGGAGSPGVVLIEYTG